MYRISESDKLYPFLAMTQTLFSKNIDTKKVNGFFTFPWGHQKHECQERVYF